jgi:hypothetical protein
MIIFNAYALVVDVQKGISYAKQKSNSKDPPGNFFKINCKQGQSAKNKRNSNRNSEQAVSIIISKKRVHLIRPFAANI